MSRPLPDIDDLPPKPEPYYMTGARSRERCAEHCRKADRIIARCYAPRSPAGNGFYNPNGFLMSTRTLAARNRIFSIIVSRLVEHDIARGRLREFNEREKRFVL